MALEQREECSQLARCVHLPGRLHFFLLTLDSLDLQAANPAWQGKVGFIRIRTSSSSAALSASTAASDGVTDSQSKSMGSKYGRDARMDLWR